MEVGKKFADLIYYNDNMRKGMEDKLFFLDNMDISKGKSYIFVDFGCADGILINTLYGIMEDAGINAYYIGYDISETMIDLAKTNFSHNASNVLFTTDWDKVAEKVSNFSSMESVLILSSVIHEVYSYSKYPSDITLFWERVLNTGFKYICVRDMMCSEDANREDKDLFWILKEHIPFATTKSRLLREFEAIWGSTTNVKNLMHFLLKYRWVINWEREVEENYFPIYVSEFLEKFNEKYNLNYFNRFRVPFLDKRWKEDFDVELNDNTHIKAIFEIKKYESKVKETE